MKIWIWLEGKRTILGGWLLIAVGVVAVLLGKLSVTDGLTLVGLGISIAGFAAKANRHQAELLDGLQAIATAGVDLRAGNTAGALGIVEKEAAAVAGPVLVASLQASQSPETKG